MPPKNTILSTTQTKETPYPNITTCLQNKCGTKKDNTPNMIINYSNNRLIGANRPKLILAHKMYGLPYLDISGEFGISNRDNYIIYKDNISDLIKLQKFLSTKTVLKVFDSTRYRMKYLEKYAFELLPDISKLPDFPEEINDHTVSAYFQLNK